jgi:hypothetical protein
MVLESKLHQVESSTSDYTKFSVSHDNLGGRSHDKTFVEDIVNEILYLRLKLQEPRYIGKLFGHNNRDDRIMQMICGELRCVGYSDTKRKMEESDIPRGRVRRGNLFIDVGVFTDFLTPEVYIEQLLCPNQKAIAIFEHWETMDDFVNDWEVKLKDIADDSFSRIVYLGTGWSSYDEGNQFSYKGYCNFEKINRDAMIRYWERADERFEALQKIDAMKDDIRRSIKYGFNDDWVADDWREYKRQRTM